MSRRKTHREKDPTSSFLSGDWDEDRIEQEQRFSDRSKHAEQNKILRTASLRVEESSNAPDIATLPIGQVIQVFSRYSEVRFEGASRLCIVRKTLSKLQDTAIVVGDRVRFRDGPPQAEQRGEGMIEEILPRQTVLTRADSFKAIDQHPIVANADQMLIVASVVRPRVKWGLIDRMLVAARGGGLKPIICLNKVDIETDSAAPEATTGDSAKKRLKNKQIIDADVRDKANFRSALTEAREALAHYRSLGYTTIETSASMDLGIDTLRDLLKDFETVLAGHSGVGKSSLIRKIQPGLDIRIGEISNFNDKGRHTTTSARRYPLGVGGAVIDTPGVKLFGLWGVTRDNLPEFFPDVAAGTAPAFRAESFERIAASLAS